MSRQLRYSQHAKRGIDLIIGSALLVLVAPLMLVIALFVRCSSQGPVIFRQQRVGYRGQTFTMLKFRTMKHKCDDGVHREYVTNLFRSDVRADPSRAVTYKLDDDPRITRVGRFLRRTSLDELPQLLNVVTGDMSLVGPRPILPWEAELLPPEFAARFAVQPGITGLWQVAGRNQLTMHEAVELDVAYVRRHSMWLDLWILVLTIPAVLRTALTGRGVR
jgi:lipopolysaccharide/colanic/teichoic acid biosynthesis glycosyltransferase